MPQGLSKQPNTIVEELSLRKGIKITHNFTMSYVSLAKAKVVIFHEPQNNLPIFLIQRAQIVSIIGNYLTLKQKRDRRYSL